VISDRARFPGRVTAGAPILLPRPRDVASASFNELRARVVGLLQHDPAVESE
jgi:hypothetical protein